MNLAIEYILRNKRVQNMLTLPCALYLTTAENRKLIVGMQNTYVSSMHLTVKHWRMWEATDKDKLPPFTEYRVNREDVFKPGPIVIAGCKILDYCESPYQSGIKQVADYPLSLSQQSDYYETLNNFYDSVSHQKNKLNWLWQAFQSIHIPEHLRYEHGHDDIDGLNLQREIVQYSSKPIWNTWLYWRKHLLDFSGVSPELVFRREYVPKEPVVEHSPRFWESSYNSYGFYTN